LPDEQIFDDVPTEAVAIEENDAYEF